MQLTSNRSRALLGRHAAALAAVAALLAQTLFPHVHAISSERVAAASPRGLVAAHRVGERAVVLATARVPSSEHDSHRHAPASCPLCRVQNDARSSMLPGSSAMPAPAAVLASSTPDTRPALAAFVRDVGVPRAPPLAS